MSKAPISRRAVLQGTLSAPIAFAGTQHALAAASLQATLEALPPGSQATFQLFGRTTTGDGGEGLFVWRTGDQTAKVALDPLAGVFVPPVADRSGKSGAWERIDRQGRASVRWFGARGDGTMDDTAAIQAAIDFASRSGTQTVHVPEGTYATSDTLHLGYGAGDHAFIQVNLQGPPRGSYSGHLTGARIKPSRTDRPAVNIQGGRNVTVSGLAFVGRHVQKAIEGLAVTRKQYSPRLEDWNDQVNVPLGLDRHRPYAAITVDAYSGPAPVDAYPSVTYPPWTKATKQYEKAYSSACLFSEVDITGFSAGIVVQPADADGNGDFTMIRDSNIVSCAIGIAVCNTQSRNVEIRNIRFVYLHTVIDTERFGRGKGQLNGPIDNVSGGHSYQFLNGATPGYSGPMTISHFYAEVLVRLGRWYQTANAPAIVFQSCRVSFEEDSYTGMSPRALLDNYYGTQALNKFIGCQFGGMSRMALLTTDGRASIESCMFDGGLEYYRNPDRMTPALQQAYRYCGGVLPLFTQASGMSDVRDYHGRHFGDARPYQWQQAHVSSTIRPGGVLTPNAEAFLDSATVRWRIRHAPGPTHFPVAVPAAFPSTPKHDGMELSGSIAAALQEAALHLAIEPGDIILDHGRCNVFVVTTISKSDSGNYRFAALLQNNFHWTTPERNVAMPNDPSVTAVGQWFLIKTGLVAPKRHLYWGDFTKDDVEVGNVHAGNSAGETAAEDIPAGMWIGTTQSGDTQAGSFVKPGARVARVANGRPASLTLTRPATRTGRFPILPFLIDAS